MRYYISMRSLTGRNYPTRFLRSEGVTLQIIDPRASKQELLWAAYDQILPWEHEIGRRAYGQPPPGVAMAQSLTEGSVLPYVPPEVRLPGEPAIQNPYLDTPEGEQAYRDALEWASLEWALSIGEQVA